MIRLFLSTFAVPAVISIIVTDPPPADIQYKYSYDIEDPTTGDKKTQYEVKQGGIVTGQYSVVDPDGTKRIVDYNVHPRKGFSAVVHIEPVSPQIPAPVRNYVMPIKKQQASVTNNAYYSDRAFNDRHLMPYPTQSRNYPESSFYFTPVKEITANSVPFHQGQYFIPSQGN